ncbi:MAG: hypothetical protein R3C51_05910 [Parvularculaceae bacterium]
MARAKILAAVTATGLLLGGCSGGLKQLAPPGILKYEDLAKGEPVDPQIKARIDAQQSDEASGYPVLADQPDFLPEGIAKPERQAMADNLIEQRNALNDAVAEDRIAASAERDGDLSAERSALDAKVQTDDAAAKAERKQPVTPIKIEPADASMRHETE